MSGALIVFSYMTAIIVGIRWQTLPEDIANVQALLTVGVSFSLSVVKQLCNKRLSMYTDNSLVYPRPPRTQISTQEETSEHADDSEGEKEEDDNEESGESEEDADVHGDTEEPDKED